ncbi:MAG: hypothetical protein PVG39_00075 [Desulfobacteraceae bacterium]
METKIFKITYDPTEGTLNEENILLMGEYFGNLQIEDITDQVITNIADTDKRHRWLKFHARSREITNE